MPKTKNAVVPRLRFPEFRDAGPWGVKKLGAYLKAYSEKVLAANNTLPVYSSSREGLKLQADYYDGRDVVNEGEYGVVPSGYFVYRHMSDDTTFKFNINDTGERIAVSKEYPVFTTAGLSARFLLYTLNEGWAFKRFAESHRKGGTRTRLYFKTLCSFTPFLPILEEQQKIADCLSSLDEVIELEAKRLDALKAHKQGLLQQLFPREGETTPRLRFPEFRDAGPWEVKKVGDVFKVTRGQVLATNLISDHYSAEAPYPVYSSQTKNNGLLGYYSDFLYMDSITWTTDGANAGDVKYRRGKFYCTNVCGVLLNDEGYANDFVANLLNSIAKKYVSYVGNPKLMNGVMAEIEIPLPKLEEQQKIADCLSSLDELIELEVKRLDALKAHKKGLMQQLFPQEVA